MVQPVLFSHAASLAHDTGTHPESPARIEAVQRAVAGGALAGWRHVDSVPASTSVLRAVHPPEHLAQIEGLARAGGGVIDMDTVVSAGSWDAALHAAGGAMAVVDALLGDGARSAASLHRPPGHHCEAGQAMGFCLLNNVAVAAQHARDAHGAQRVMIIDWDVHHGNGTNDIFAPSDGVLFASLHQAPLYPGTGPAADVGHGAGEGFTINVPMPAGSGDADWLAVFEHVLAPIGRVYAPQLILISAGFDAHVDDPLGGCSITDAGFARMADVVSGVGRQVEAPVGLVLEGGYDVDALARSFVASLDVLAGDVTVTASAVDVSPHAQAARDRAARYWEL